MQQHWASHGRNLSAERESLICQFGMAEEMGEVVGHFKREVRGDPKPREELLHELGDVLHYLHRYMQINGIHPDEVREMNHDKLVERYDADKG